MTRNLCLLLSYDGTDFHGWQRQPQAPTLQGILEETLQKITGESVVLYGSGRTDAGVHASGQVANFKTNCRIPCANLRKALNDALPPALRVREVKEVPDHFHARYSARCKTYRYRILEAPICPPFLWRHVYQYAYPLNHDRMAAAARWLEGEHDFTSFAGAGGQAGAAADGMESASRVIFESRILWRPRSRILTYQVRGSGFLHYMVRNIVGTLIQVGSGKLQPEDIVHILEARDRTAAGPTAPARGLCLVRVQY